MSKSTRDLETLKGFLNLELNKPYTNEELTNIINTPTQDRRGNTPLIKATYTSNSEIVKLLLEYGAKDSINSQDKLGDTPLHYAIYKNNSELVKLLLANGAQASINTQNQAGDTPLREAIDNSNSELVKLLLEYGAKDSINTQNQAGDTPLLKAIDKNNSELVKLLLEYGAKDSINTPNQWGNTPLIKAINRSNSELVKLLLENGAKIDLRLSEHLSNSKINGLPEDIKYKLSDMVFCFKNDINSESDNKSSDRIDNLFITFNLGEDDLLKQLLDIAINNIDLLNIDLFLQDLIVSDLIVNDPSILEDKLFGLEGLFSKFTPEFRELYNLPKYIKMNSENLSQFSSLREKLNDLHDKNQTLFTNYELIKAFVSANPAIAKKFKEFEEKYLDFNEDEAVGCILRILAPEETDKVVTSQSLFDNSKLHNKGSLYEDDEKEPILSENSKESDRAEKIFDIAFEYRDIFSIASFFKVSKIYVFPYSLQSTIKETLGEKELHKIFNSLNPLKETSPSIATLLVEQIISLTTNSDSVASNSINHDDEDDFILSLSAQEIDTGDTHKIVGDIGHFLSPPA